MRVTGRTMPDLARCSTEIFRNKRMSVLKRWPGHSKTVGPLFEACWRERLYLDPRVVSRAEHDLFIVAAC